MKNLKLISLALIIVSVHPACAFSHYGQANTGFFDIEPPNIKDNMKKAEIIRLFGVPDSNITFDGKEYWRYKNKSGWFILLGGKTKEKDLIIEFKGEKIKNSYILNKGSSIGIIIFQGAVAN